MTFNPIPFPNPNYILTTTTMAAPKIILYTYRGCPWAHRAHIALRETGLDYEEVGINLDKPREPWYLEINPVLKPPFRTLLSYILPHSTISN
jgi:glutathione S-transferase